MKRLFLHVGTHKTGTTSLQNFLSTNRRALLERGILVPISGCPQGGGGHHNIAWELNGDSRFHEDYGTLDDLYEEVRKSECDTVLVSSEDFEYLYCNPEALLHLRDTLNAAGCQVEVVLVTRQLHDYIQSLFLELRKHGLTLSLPEFKTQVIDSCSFVLKGNWRFCFNYQRLEASFSGVFGGDKVRRLEYITPIEPEFLRQMELPLQWSEFEPVPTSNLSSELMQDVPSKENQNAV